MTNSGLFLSLNSADAPTGNRQWVHVLPAGRVARVDAGEFDCSDIAGILANSQRVLDNSQTGLLVDYDHAADLAAPRGEPAIAAGWIVELAARQDGIWGLVEWTAKAAAHLASKEYRGLSPVLAVDPKTPRSPWRPTAVLRAALTNTPALAQLTALASQGNQMDQTAPNDGPGAAIARAYATLKTGIIEAMGLDPSIDEAKIVQAVADLVASSKSAALNSAVPDPSQFVPIAMLQQTQAELNKLRQGVSLNAAQELVGKHISDGIILPFQRDWAVQLCQANLPSYEAYIAGCGPGFSHLRKRVIAGGAPPAALNSAASDPTIVHMANLMGFEPAELAEHHNKLHSKG